MNPFGIILTIVCSLAPLFWFAELFSRDPLAILSQYFGSVALIIMGVSQLLATRWRPLESLFGGLDRIYVQHKWLGISAMGLILLHDTIDAEMRGARETFLSELGETLGELSLYGLLILVTISLLTFVPYPLWKWSHRFVGAFFAFSALHFFWVPRPFELAEPLGLYVSFFCVLGVCCYLITLLQPMIKVGKARYRVEAVEETGGAIALSLFAEGTGLRHKSGQFAFISCDVPGLGEPHPFTISSGPRQDRSLRFSIRPLGDYTRALGQQLQPGACVTVSGPHGRFLRPKSSSAPQVWIAGGIGITPFLAWLEQRSEAGDTSKVDLFYCVRNRSQAPHLEEIERLVAENQTLILHLIESEQGRRLSAADIEAALGGDVSSASIWYCGPESLRDDLKRGLLARGLPRRRFHYEEFEIRSGLDVIGWAVRLISHCLKLRDRVQSRSS